MDNDDKPKTLLLTDIPRDAFRIIEREALRQARPVTYLLRKAVIRMAMRIVLAEERRAELTGANQKETK